MSDEAAKVTAGWGWPGSAKKAHYFTQGRSLCGKWMYFGELSTEGGSGPDDCRACTRQLGPAAPGGET